MAKRTKQKKQVRKARKKPEHHAAEKVPRLAHKILTQTIWPAKLDLADAMEVVITLAKAVVISNTDDDDPDDRSELITCVEGHFLSAMAELDPYGDHGDHEHDHVHAWLVAPQGLITEPVGFLWSGSADDGVQVLIGAELEALRAELAVSSEETCVIVTEGVEGLAMTDPEWDGVSTIPCSNPQCGNVHDVHLMVAENLFQQAKQQPQTQPN